jgi:hypothetical protein
MDRRWSLWPCPAPPRSDASPVQDSAHVSASVWIAALAGATAGLLASIVGHLLLDVPKVKVRVRDDLHGDPETGTLTVSSYVEVTNIRGRPVTIEGAGFLIRGAMRFPRGWQADLPARLEEGGRVMFTFERSDYPMSLVPVAMDTVRRVWPRRRRWSVRWRALKATGLRGFVSGRKGPTKWRIERVRRRIEAGPPDRFRAD